MAIHPTSELAKPALVALPPFQVRHGLLVSYKSDNQRIISQFGGIARLDVSSVDAEGGVSLGSMPVSATVLVYQVQLRMCANGMPLLSQRLVSSINLSPPLNEVRLKMGRRSLVLVTVAAICAGLCTAFVPSAPLPSCASGSSTSRRQTIVVSESKYNNDSASEYGKHRYVQQIQICLYRW